MFTRIRLKNFKAWKDSGDIRLAPVTLLLGENSSGKSSILQSLLLMKQTFESTNQDVHLNLGGDDSDLVDFGSFKGLVNRGCSGNCEISLSIGEINGVEHLNASFSITSDEGRAVLDKAACNGSEMRAFGFNGFEIKNDIAGYTIRETGTNEKAAIAHDDLSHLLKISTEAKRTNEINSRSVLAAVIDTDFFLTISAHGIVYLSAYRSRLKRFYYQGQKGFHTVGINGEHAIPLIISSLSNDSGTDLIDFLSYWLNKMGVADKIEARNAFGSYEILIHRDGIAANILDVGIGVAQVLPVLVQTYLMPERTTLIFEEPEIHLHPKAQALLADLFLEVSKERNVQFLVETHSEHLFRRLQTRVAEQKASADDCALYFVEREGAEAKLKDLKLDQFGRVAEWPKNFFGDATGEVRSQAIESMRRMKEQRKK
ncbi:DUF3696 domain-containing protein [Pelagibaculum spongiae]|uniref:DUF3696 domain-containing protein n=1 Tax=Pelagibaculum spongiae TaxID=2080658 RepID=A0A2V1GXB2_9GAMM|nr:DUF3696 domain-containing protein [Pelagibaculum spongiae]PVZ70660.1 hypothetical protein DC094_08785 [Pelagibaculum spongiae]